MITKIKSTIGMICVFSLSTLVHAQTPQTLSLKNQRGSTMNITLIDEGNSTGTIKGSFTTAVGNCQIEVGKPMALSGFYSGNAVTLSVNYPKCKKTIAMTGHFNADRTELDTLWMVAEESADPKGKNWNANIVGSDHYQRQSA